MSEDTPTERLNWGRRSTDGVTVSTNDMYQLLVKMDHTLTRLDSSVTQQGVTIADHEARLRQVESDGLNERRVEAMEEDVKAIRGDIEGLKRKVYAIPSLSAAVAAAALVITLIRWL
jgi:cob(I)alamin adenosyltransferase